MLIVPNRKYTAVVMVRREGVKVTLNGKPLLQATSYSALQAGSWHRADDWQKLAVFCDDPTMFFEIAVNEVTGAGTVTRKPDADSKPSE